MAKYDQCNLELSQFYCGLTFTYTKQNSLINEYGRLCFFFLIFDLVYQKYTYSTSNICLSKLHTIYV